MSVVFGPVLKEMNKLDKVKFKCIYIYVCIYVIKEEIRINKMSIIPGYWLFVLGLIFLLSYLTNRYVNYFLIRRVSRCL